MESKYGYSPGCEVKDSKSTTDDPPPGQDQPNSRKFSYNTDNGSIEQLVDHHNDHDLPPPPPPSAHAHPQRPPPHRFPGDGTEAEDERTHEHHEHSVTRSRSPDDADDDEQNSPFSSLFKFRPVNTYIPIFLILGGSVGLLLTSTLFAPHIVQECDLTHHHHHIKDVDVDDLVTQQHHWYCSIPPQSLLLYLHCLFWGLSLICDQVFQYQHIVSRRRGYLDFYSETRTLSQLPFWIVSTWSTLLLAVSTILNDHCVSEPSCGTIFQFDKVEYISFFFGLELVLLSGVLLKYLGRVWRFNRARGPPDVFLDDLLNTSRSVEFEASGGGPGRVRHDVLRRSDASLLIGPSGTLIDDGTLYERQADMIRYYKEHNAMLSKTLMAMSRQLYSRPSNVAAHFT